MCITDLSLSSSLEHSERSSTAPAFTACQRSIHAPKWDDWRKTAHHLASSHDPDLQRRGSKIAACACCPVFCVAAGARLRLSPGFCRDRLCPTCAHRRSRQTFHALRSAVEPMDSPRFVTLTLKHKTEPLFLTLARLRGGLATLRRSPIWKAAVVGGVYSVEVKRNAQTGCWHAHVHMIIDGQFIAQNRLSEAWKAATGDSFIVDIRAVRSRRDVVSYITKYISKPADLSSLPRPAIEEYARDMVGVRCVQTFGNCHGRRVEPEDDGCVVQQVEPLTSTATLLRRLNQGCSRAAAAVWLLNRHGGMFRRAAALPQPPEDDQPAPLTQDEHAELIDHLRWLGRHTPITEVPEAVWRVKRATLRIDECPWP